MDSIANPHDAFFRESFSRREIAEDFLRQQLPDSLLAALDLSTLEIAKDTYIASDLRASWIFNAEPLVPLRELIDLIEQIEDRHTAVEILESLLRYYVQGTQRIAEEDVRQLLQTTATGDPVMQTFIDRYIEQGREQGREQGQQQGEARVLMRLIERKFGQPPERVRQRILEADSETLLNWSERILTADTLDAVLH